MFVQLKAKKAEHAKALQAAEAKQAFDRCLLMFAIT